MSHLATQSLHSASALSRELGTAPTPSAWGARSRDDNLQALSVWTEKARELRNEGCAAAAAGDGEAAKQKLQQLETLITEIRDYKTHIEALATTAATRLFQHQIAATSAAHLSRQLGHLQRDTEQPLSREHHELAQALQGALQRHPHGAPVSNWKRELMRRHVDVTYFCGRYAMDKVNSTLSDAFAHRDALWRVADPTDPFLMAVGDDLDSGDSWADWEH